MNKILVITFFQLFPFVSSGTGSDTDVFCLKKASVILDNGSLLLLDVIQHTEGVLEKIVERQIIFLEIINHQSKKYNFFKFLYIINFKSSKPNFKFADDFFGLDLISPFSSFLSLENNMTFIALCDLRIITSEKKGMSFNWILLTDYPIIETKSQCIELINNTLKDFYLDGRGVYLKTLHQS